MSSAAWRPSAEIGVLRRRAAVIAKIRAFFAERGVLEVETPALAAAPVTDVHLHSLNVELEIAGGIQRFYLQTSPEFAMKRLLAAGTGAIFQISRCFRADESGRRHNPEFTLLEWYRPGFDHHDLMAEVDLLLQATLGCASAERLTYREAFERAIGIDPHEATTEDLAATATRLGLEVEGFDHETATDDWLHLLMSHCVEATLGIGRPTLLFDYPASQAALARVQPGPPAIAERFEVYVDGVELANGFHELTDAVEQRRRFDADLAERRHRGLPLVPIDERLLAALAAGLPDCAGVALGVDRLVMLATAAHHIDEVLAFPIASA